MGCPQTLSSDRHGIFVRQSDRPPTLTEQLTGKRTLTQVGRALEEAGIGWLAAGSAQAKGRVERLWGTLQDRLLVELRLETITTIGEANAFLPGFLLRHNARFAVPPADPEPAWRAWPAGLAAESVFCFHYPRRVARDATVSSGRRRARPAPSTRRTRLGRLRDRARRTPRRLALGAPRGPPLPARRGPRSACATPGPPSLAPQRGTARRASQRARPGAWPVYGTHQTLASRPRSPLAALRKPEDRIAGRNMARIAGRRHAAPTALDRSRPQAYHSTWAGWTPPIGARLASGVEPPPISPNLRRRHARAEQAGRPLSR